jgi:polyketide synthase 12
VRTVACDVGDRDALAAVVRAARPLTGVVHAAGTLADGVVTALTPDQVHEAMRAKAEGAWHLHELTRTDDLALFVVFSSAAGLLGSAGQGAYNAANTFVDALARARQAQGLPATALAWGPWHSDGGGGGGMTSHLGSADEARMRRTGAIPLTTADGIDLWDEAVGRDEPVLVPVRLDPAAARDVAPILRGIVRAPELPRAAAARTATVSVGERIAAMSRQEADHVLLELVREQVALVLSYPSGHDVAPDRSFRELGFDSLTGVELRNRLNGATGLVLPATLVFDHPSPGSLAGFLAAELIEDTDPVSAALAELDRLERVLAALPPDGEVAARVTRLNTTYSRRHRSHGGNGFAEALDAADADEVFSLIDTTLSRGRSGPETDVAHR